MSESIADPGHLLPPDEWARVVADAEAHPENPAPRQLGLRKLGPSSFPSVTGFIQAKYNGGAQPSGPTFGVLHDAETPLQAGYARSIANYFARNTNQTSAHFMVDPVDTIQMLDTGLVAWHCGNGNTRSIGVEQAGYASFTGSQWTTANGAKQMARVAALMRDINKAHGIGLYWMSDQQLRDAWAGKIVGGWTTHDQCRRVLGGTTHTDPMPNYPLAALMAQAARSPAPVPAPTSAHPPVLAWNLPAGNYYGNIAGPAQCHGGINPAEKAFVANIWQWLIYHGCVPGHAPGDWRNVNASVARWGADMDAQMATWHARFYPQPKPTQCWADDYVRLARA